MNYFKIFFLTTLFLFQIMSCTNPKETAILGAWQAVEVLEERNNLPVDVSEIKLNFQKNGDYTYNSTLKYKEAGMYHLNSNLLYTKDSIQKSSIEKAVKILKVDKDSLIIQMMEEEKERIVKMVRSK